MEIDLMTLIMSIVPAIISYFIANKNANNKIESIKEETERDIKSIRADTQREIEKIKAETEREIEKINAETESQIKIMEAQSKAKENEKMNDLMYGPLGDLFSNMVRNPKAIGEIIKISTKGNPTQEDVLNLIGIASNKKDE